MSELEIVTNNKRRELKEFFGLPEKAREDFDYVNGEDSFTPRFVKYQGCWYDTHDTMRIDFAREPAPHPFKGWGSYISETFFSGVLFKWGGDDTIIVGRWYS